MGQDKGVQTTSFAGPMPVPTSALVKSPADVAAPTEGTPTGASLVGETISMVPTRDSSDHHAPPTQQQAVVAMSAQPPVHDAPRATEHAVVDVLAPVLDPCVPRHPLPASPWAQLPMAPGTARPPSNHIVALPLWRPRIETVQDDKPVQAIVPVLLLPDAVPRVLPPAPYSMLSVSAGALGLCDAGSVAKGGAVASREGVDSDGDDEDVADGTVKDVNQG